MVMLCVGATGATTGIYEHHFYIRTRILHVLPFLLGADDNLVEISIDDGGAESSELSDELHEQLLHQLVDHAAESWFVHHGAGGADPPEGMGSQVMNLV